MQAPGFAQRQLSWLGPYIPFHGGRPASTHPIPVIPLRLIALLDSYPIAHPDVLTEFFESSNAPALIGCCIALAKGWKEDLNLFNSWCHITLNDLFEGESSMFVENPRQIALQVLVRQYSQYPKTLELLNNRAVNDTDKTFRDGYDLN